MTSKCCGCLHEWWYKTEGDSLYIIMNGEPEYYYYELWWGPLTIRVQPLDSPTETSCNLTTLILDECTALRASLVASWTLHVAGMNSKWLQLRTAIHTTLATTLAPWSTEHWTCWCCGGKYTGATAIKDGSTCAKAICALLLCFRPSLLTCLTLQRINRALQ